jgi:hypothetical protein
VNRKKEAYVGSGRAAHGSAAVVLVPGSLLGDVSGRVQGMLFSLGS